ncbi:hypothetical protein HBB16_15765 [Pseudonocardia sp. MCCB 268]|nr:hypothetical protein [Pseudonocardia cytotoxica]
MTGPRTRRSAPTCTGTGWPKYATDGPLTATVTAGGEVVSRTATSTGLRPGSPSRLTGTPTAMIERFGAHAAGSWRAARRGSCTRRRRWGRSPLARGGRAGPGPGPTPATR